MSDDLQDTGTIAEVPPEARLDTDDGFGSNALAGGDDTEDLADVFADPGEVALIGGE